MSSMIDVFEVRQRIAADHALLRSLIHALIAVSRITARDERHRVVIQGMLGQLFSEVERHFDFERERIVPLLREVDAWGPARAEQLEKDHEERRTVLVALVEDADDGARSLDELADEILWFVERFEQEMSAEERLLLEAEALGAEPVVDQVDG